MPYMQRAKQGNFPCLQEFVRIISNLLIHNNVAHSGISGAIVYRVVKAQPVEMSH